MSIETFKEELQNEIKKYEEKERKEFITRERFKTFIDEVRIYESDDGSLLFEVKANINKVIEKGRYINDPDNTFEVDGGIGCEFYGKTSSNVGAQINSVKRRLYLEKAIKEFSNRKLRQGVLEEDN